MAGQKISVPKSSNANIIDYKIILKLFDLERTINFKVLCIYGKKVLITIKRTQKILLILNISMYYSI